MAVISIANPKGGVGKTTIADELAFCFEARGIVTGFLNLDRQGGTIHESVNPTNAQHLIIDTPGRVTDDLPDVLMKSDILLVPTEPSIRGLPALQRVMELAKRYAVPAHIVVNRFDSRRLIDRDFYDLAEERYSIIGTLPTSTLFARSAAAKTGVTQFAPRTKAAKSMEKLADSVLDMVS